TAAKKDRLHETTRRERSHMRNFTLVAFNERVFVKSAAMDMRIEITIGALGRAEGPMHVDPEEIVGISHARSGSPRRAQRSGRDARGRSGPGSKNASAPATFRQK